MPAVERGEPIQNTQHHDQHRRSARIREQVVQALGKITDLQVVQVRPLWGDHFRVNVYVGEDVASVKVAHSYFLVVADDGTILASIPALSNQA